MAFIGGAQIDPYGNVNSTCIYGKGDYVKPQTRFTGSGGANGIATYCNTIIMMQHQKRRFICLLYTSPMVERVCRLWLRLHGYGCRFAVEWDDINLQDLVEEAKAGLNRRLRQCLF